MRVTLKSLTKENAKIEENNLFLSERNNVLESQFIEFEKLRIECKISKDECNDAINDMSTELYHLRVTLKSLTKENAKI